MIPTRFGLACGVLFLFFTITAAHYANNLIFLMAFILVSFLLISILQTAKNLRGLTLIKVQMQPGFPDQTTVAQVLVQNTKTSPKMGIGLQFGKQKPFFVIDEISAEDKKWISLPFVLPSQRGRYSTTKVKVFTDAPYGLFYGWYNIYRTDQTVVYPRPIGENSSTLQNKSLGSDFSGLIDFQNGDSLSRVSWKHSAQRDQLLVKEFKDETPQLEIYRLADCPQKDIEDKLSQLCLWITQAEKQKIKYGLQLHEPLVLVGSGEKHSQECLYQLGVF